MSERGSAGATIVAIRRLAFAEMIETHPIVGIQGNVASH